MGRYNNRRTQAAAEALKNTPSRARFSQPPPRKRKSGGRGRNGAGRDAGGRGGRSNNNAQAKTKTAVVQKISQRVQNRPTSSSQQRLALDKSKLDELTLSEASKELVNQLLKDLNVVQTNDLVPKTVETQATHQTSQLQASAPAYVPSLDSSADTHPAESAPRRDMVTTSRGYSEYEDDGQEEDYRVNGWNDETAWEGEEEEDEPDMDQESSHVLQDDEPDIDPRLQQDPVFCHLTVQLSFAPKDAARAIEQGKFLLPNNNNESNAGIRVQLAAAMDWLCLHLTEPQLEAGFVKNVQYKEANQQSRIILAGTGSTRSIPHPSISVAKKLTEDTEWRKLARLEERAVGFLLLGFHYAEAMKACEETDTAVPKESVNAMHDSPTLRILLSMLEREVLVDDEVGALEGAAAELHNDTEETIEEREQEREALSAIYDDQFQILESTNGLERYLVKVPSEDLEVPADSSENDLHVFIRPGYPANLVPLFLLHNPNLPAPLLRQVNAEMIRTAHASVGVPVIFDVITFLASELPTMQKDYIKKQRLEEFEEEQLRLRRAAGHSVDEDDFDDDRKVGRRQRARLKGAEKAFDRDGQVQRDAVERSRRQQERLELVQDQNRNIRQTMAQRALEEREKEKTQAEMEKVARAAMNAALIRGESTEQAREAAQLARKAYMCEHGIRDPSDDQESHETTGDSEERNGIGGNNVDDSDGDNRHDEENGRTAVASKATPTTLAFMDRLRSMYQAAAEQKASGSYTLSEPKKRASQKYHEEVSDDDEVYTEALPRPVAVPVGDVAKLMEEVVAVQSDQPWLVSDEARVPGVEPHTEVPDPVQLKRQQEISKTLLEELEKRKGSRPFKKMLAQRERLPAYAMRHEIVETVAKNQITVIAAETGAGKTTQVPQLVLDDFIQQHKGSEACAIVTQPRRISAIGVAERVASERCERVGETCGYSIKLERKTSKKTRLLFCTTGILLRRLQCDPDLAAVSHVFVDEVHERDLNTDFLLIILKDLLSRRGSLKLVLMSATLNADAFSAFFDGCAIVSIPGRTHPVQEFRLEDVLQLTGYEVPEGSDYAAKTSALGRPSKTALRGRYYPKYNSKVIHSLSIVDETVVNYELLAELLEYISLNSDEGAILVFLPGMMEITKAIDELRRKEFFQDPSKALVLPLHSSLSTAEQTAVFQVPPNGVRKIVCATNIAETSITIEDVVYVVDSGRVKENRRDEVKETPALVECWVSRASAKQRRGRAGRVREGFAYHLYSSHTHDDVMQDYQLPEIRRVGLEDLALQILILDLGEPSSFLARAMDPPTGLAMKNSLKLLEELGAVECRWLNKPLGLADSIDENTDDSCADLSVTTELTALGFHLASLPVEPRVGKMMIYGALFGCVEPALTIAASMSSKNPFVSPFDSRDAANEARQQFATEGSDHLTVLKAFDEWREMRRQKGDRSVQSFLRKNFLSRMTLFQMEELRKQYSKLLIDIGFLPERFRLTGKEEGSNANASNLALVKAVLCAGLYPNILVAPRPLVNGTNKQEAGEVAFQSLSKGEVYLHPCTILFSSKQLDSRYCCFHEIVKTSKMYVRDCTTVSPFALVLFGGALEVYHGEEVVSVDHWLKFRISAKPATLVKHLRNQMESMLLRKIIAPEDDATDSPEAKALIKIISTLLRHEGKPNASVDSNRTDGAEIVRPWHGHDGSGRGRNGNRGRGRGRSSRNGRGRGGGRCGD